jgi:uncharacterized protein (DUF934 family)
MSNPLLDLALADRFVPTEPAEQRLVLSNDSDPREVDLSGITVVELQFPKFTDGRAFSQAFLLRRRLGFAGVIRATGDVLLDQLVQMQRSGFTQAVLRADQNLAHGQALLAHYPAFYQGDAVVTTPHFVAPRVAAPV